jgi:fructosamine-3-kinase
MWTEIQQHISTVIGQKFVIKNRQPIGGGCINQCYAISDDHHKYFVKLNNDSASEMFTAESLGLQQMFATQTITVPQLICWGNAVNHSYLILEYLNLGGRGNWEEMGRKLAEMHNYQPQNKSFGWDINNTIGSTPQINTWVTDWTDFFKEYRIEFQLKLARRNGGIFIHGNQLLKKIPEILANHHPQPSLVHGDLWGGNAGFTNTGKPAIFDPATYIGDREVDIAMSELFGGFPPSFYQGYNQVFPLDSGYQKRKTLYNLYHIFNHFNLFGGNYEGQANRMIEQLLK